MKRPTSIAPTTALSPWGNLVAGKSSDKPKALTATTEATATADDLRAGRCTPGQIEGVIAILDGRSDNLDRLADARASWSGDTRGVVRKIVAGHAARLLNLPATEQWEFVRDTYRQVRRTTRGPDRRIVRAELELAKRSL